MDQPRSDDEHGKYPLFKPFEIPDLIPYSIALLMAVALGYFIYLLRYFKVEDLFHS